MSRYVYMLTDTPSDEPPKLYGSRKRALAELERLFKETLEEAIFLKPKDKAELETAFRENKTWFTIIDAPPEERNTRLHVREGPAREVLRLDEPPGPPARARAVVHERAAHPGRLNGRFHSRYRAACQVGNVHLRVYPHGISGLIQLVAQCNILRRKEKPFIKPSNLLKHLCLNEKTRPI